MKGDNTMKKVFALLLAGVLTLSLFTACDSGKTIVESKVAIPAYNKNELVNEAVAIVEGEVISSEVKNDQFGFPATDYTIRVTKVFKGNPASEVVVRTAGGENDEMKYIPDGAMVTFELGEKVVLFLSDGKGDRLDRVY
jgi:hypothetical protein